MRDRWVSLLGSFGVGAFGVSLFIWHGGAISGGVVEFNLAVGGIDDGGFGGSSRYDGSVSAAAMVGLDSVYLLAAE